MVIQFNRDPERIDKYLSTELEDYTRSYIQKLIRSGAVQVDGETVRASYILSGGEEITLELPELKEPEILPKSIPLDILYEDQDLLVVNKPKGMVVHPAPGHYDDTLVNGLMAYCRDDLSGIGGVARPGIVHRIDKNTSGTLLVCATIEALSVAAQKHKQVRSEAIWEDIPKTGRKDLLSALTGVKLQLHIIRSYRNLRAIRYLNLSLKPDGHIRSVFTWPRSIIRCLPMIFTARVKIRSVLKDRCCTLKRSVLFIPAPVSIWNFQLRYQSILKIFSISLMHFHKR